MGAIGKAYLIFFPVYNHNEDSHSGSCFRLSLRQRLQLQLVGRATLRMRIIRSRQ